MSQSPWGPPLQQQEQEQDPLPMEVDSSAGVLSCQIELAYPQITLPQQQDSLPMSIDHLGGGEDKDELISRLRSCPLLSPPRSPHFSSASPPDIWVTPWDPYTWNPPCSPQIDRAAAALPDIGNCQNTEILLSWLPKFSIPEGITFMDVIPWRRRKHSVRIRNLDDDGEEEEEEEEEELKAHPRNPYGPSELVQQQFKFTPDGELQYCIRCNKVFRSDTRLTDLNKHLTLSHTVLVLLNLVAVYTPQKKKSSWEIPDIETALNLTCAWYIKGAASGNEKPKEIDSQKSASRHVESPLAFDQSNAPPERMRVDNGKAAASIDAVQHRFFEEPAGASNSRGLLEGCQSASEAARGNEKPKEIDSQKSASRHVELPLDCVWM